MPIYDKGKAAFKNHIAETHKGALNVFPRIPQWNDLSERRKKEWERAAIKNELPRFDCDWLKRNVNLS